VHRREVLSTSALALWVALPSVAVAQERKGFWAEFGVGAGSISISTDVKRQQTGAMAAASTTLGLSRHRARPSPPRSAVGGVIPALRSTA
jgi:hypothetical protein